MADFEPPSFSLGVDDPVPDSESHIPTSVHHPSCSTFELHHDLVVDQEGDFEVEVMNSNPAPETETDPPRVLRRLRRGPTTEGSRTAMEELKRVCCDNDDEDIEEFSSQEDACPAARYSSVCSSSKVPLRGNEVFTTQRSSRGKAKNKELVSNSFASSGPETGCTGLVFPKLTTSPLRRFQLIDSSSDSDPEEPSATSEHKRKSLMEKHQNKDLWKDFCPIKSFHISTPVLDEVCEEYFKSIRDNKTTQELGNELCPDGSLGCYQPTNNIPGLKHCWNSSNPLPPAYHYFFHDDPRIQKLVRSRLPNFFPLGVVNNDGDQQHTETAIDYMSQFTSKASKQGSQKNQCKKASTKGASKKSNARKVSTASEGWVDPKGTAAIPMDAGKRRVHSNGQAAGHWYTSPDGKKIYVSRSGQELSGRVAYRHYRKDNGGFKKSKKKTISKRRKS
ncbi:hypothetical protein K2173_003080 [Erythroxylum novogranatense]|uniref:Uncharacterized protein n=1 Tax=Erythroxylum novogranatense TaxID=1862640 RepID=A0AAV8TBW7_9ROSI|nr:hypothetical protein K2173_003080 [Erythroxylum novogranatense]